MAARNFTETEENYYRNYAHKGLKYSSPYEEYTEYSSKNKKTCSKCCLEKYLSSFRGNTAGSDPFDSEGYRLRRPECSECSKNTAKSNNVAKKKAEKEGISYKAPEGTKCAMTGELPKNGERLVFDHSHETDTFRGYVVSSKNRGLGLLGDNVEELLEALNYLNRSEKKKIIQDEMTGEIKIVD